MFGACFYVMYNKYESPSLGKYMFQEKKCLFYIIFIFVFSINLQYGFVNHALELLVLRNYGPEVWEDIK